jgi:hypothetical protein
LEKFRGLNVKFTAPRDFLDFQNYFSIEIPIE